MDFLKTGLLIRQLNENEQVAYWLGKEFAIHVSDKGLVCRLY